MHVQTVRRDKATVTVTARKGGLLRRLGWRCNVLGFSEDDAQVLKNVRQDCDVRLCAGDPCCHAGIGSAAWLSLLARPVARRGGSVLLSEVREGSAPGG